MTRPGDRLELRIERVATGGRMIARHDGWVVLVSGALPGEVVEARVERVQKHTVWAAATLVIERSPDRVEVAPGLGCGGHVLAHVNPARQLELKAEMLADALRRIGKCPIEAPIPVAGGPLDGYRTRARVHVRDRRVGFFDEGTHRVCAIAGTRQLSVESAAALEAIGARVASAARRIDAEIEWAEDARGTEAVAHVTASEHLPDMAAAVGPAVAGVSWCRAGRAAPVEAAGLQHVTDVVHVGPGAQSVAVRHQARAFFQGNRYLLQALVDDVMARVAGRSACDLYAGVGLFALGAAARGLVVDAVEGHPLSAADLRTNAASADGRVTCHQMSVEAYLSRGPTRPADVVIVDPPRAGLGPAVLDGLIARPCPRIVYVSCDAATLARDARRLVAAGYTLRDVRGFDLFPRTGHVEAVTTFERVSG